MRIMNIFCVMILSITLIGCYKPSSPEEKEFVSLCKAQTDLSDKSCGCVFNKLKEKYTQSDLLEMYIPKDENSSTRGNNLYNSVYRISIENLCR